MIDPNDLRLRTWILVGGVILLLSGLSKPAQQPPTPMFNVNVVVKEADSGNPIINFYAAVTRKSPFGVPNEWYGRQKVTREEALRILTVNAAYASFEEDKKGSLEAGKLADLVVLSQDIMTIPEDEILKTEVVMTVLDGKIIYSR